MTMAGLQGQSLSRIFSILIIIVSVAVAENGTATVKQQDGKDRNRAASQSHLSKEEFQDWIEDQERRVVEKIMGKIASPNDTSIQHEVKMAVARYLVNVTFTAMTRRLEILKSGKRQAFVPETAKLPASPVLAIETTTQIATMMSGNDTATEVQSNVTSTTEGMPLEPFVFKGEEGVPSNDSSLPSSAGAPPTLPVSATQEEQSSSGNETGTTTKPKPLWEELLTFNFSAALMGGGEGGSLLNRLNSGELGGLISRLNGPEGGSLLSRLGGGGNNGSEGGGFLSRLNLTALGGGNGGSLFDRLNLTALGGEGGNRGSLFDRFNLTALGGEGGNGDSLFDRLNLTALGVGGADGGNRVNLFDRLNLTGIGGDGGNLFARLNLTSIGGGEGGNLFARLNLTGLGGGEGGNGGNLFARLNLTSIGGGEGGNLFARLNLTALGGGGESGTGNGIFSHFNLSSLRRPSGAEGNDSNAEGTGLPFNLPPPPEGLFHNPPPPPKNDSVRMSQMFLGSQVEKLMGDINNSNLTGIVESTFNIATPSTVGVLVNALLNIVLCNPLDRFNGYCGVE